ncbi:LamG-like jellyroll fold domain-containing protein [Nanoarchaeota archaeon]
MRNNKISKKRMMIIFSIVLAMLTAYFVYAASPTLTQPTLSSTFGTNTKDENITASTVVTDTDGDNTTAITTWYNNGNSIIPVNMPFDSDNSCGAGCTKDYSGNGNNGSVLGSPSWTTEGYIGGSYEYDGEDDFINITNDPSMDGQSFSVTVWFKVNTFQDPWMGLLVKMDSDWKNGWRIRFRNATYKDILVNADNGTGSYGTSMATPQLSEDTWYHLAMTYDYETQQEKFYLNGTLVDSNTAIPTMYNNVSNNLIIGRLFTRNFNGTIDEVKLYDRALTQEQIEAIYANRTDLIVSQETIDGETWQTCITPNDGGSDGTEKCSAGLTVENRVPTQIGLVVNSTYTTNSSSENITVHYSSTDPEGSDTTEAINWYRDGESLMVLNMPFEAATAIHTGLTDEAGVWYFEDNMNDLSGNNNNGICTNCPAYTTDGKVDGTYEFDGVNDYINVGDDSSLNIGTSDYTLSAWVKVNGAFSFDSGIIALDGSADFDQSGFWLGINNSNGIPQVWVSNGSDYVVGTAANGFAATTDLSDGNWHHIVWIWDRDAGNKFYIDGKLDTTDTATNNDNIASSKNFSIGGEPNPGAAYSINGAIDEVHVFKHTLTEQEVTNLFKKGLDHNKETLDYANKNIGRIINATWDSTGGFDGKGAYELDGDGTGIEIPDNDFSDYFDEITIIAWARLGYKNWSSTEFQIRNQQLIRRLSTFSLVQSTSTNLLFRVWNESDHNDFYVANDISTPPGWQHIAATYKNGTMKVYLDGEFVNDKILAHKGPIGKANNANNISLMSDETGNSVLNGSIDEVKIYNKSLSAEQIKAIYNNRTDIILSQETNYGETWRACITPNDGYDDGATNCSNSLTLNSPPNITYTGFSPDPVHSNETLSIDITPTDADGNVITLWIRWFVNGMLSWWQKITDVVSGTTVQANLSSSNFTKDDEVTVEVTAGDYVDNSTAQNISTITVGNLPPVNSKPILNTSSGTNGRNENLTVYPQITDPDGETPTPIISWYKDGRSLLALNMPFESNNTCGTDCAKDYSGHGNNGSLIDAIWNPTGGYDGRGAYELDGEGDGIEIQHDSTIDIFDEITVMAWVSFGSKNFTSTEFNIRNQIVMSSGSSFLLVHQDSDYILWRIYNQTSANTDMIYNHDISTPLGWEHVAATYKQGVMKIYINGQLAKTKTIDHTGPIGKPNTQNTYLMSTGGAGSVLNGSLDEARIYNRSLSAEQIKAIYNNHTDLIVSQETSVGETWQACVTPNDGIQEDDEQCSNIIAVSDVTPTQGNPLLVSSSGTNSTYENLTVYNQSTSDGDGDSVKNIISWYERTSPQTILNMPFEALTILHKPVSDEAGAWYLENNYYDATANSNDGSCTDCPTYTADGKIGGAYEFDGTNDYINVGDDSSLNIGTTDYAVSAWVKVNGAFSFDSGIIAIDGSTDFDQTGFWLAINKSNGIPMVWVSNGTGYVVGTSANGFAATTDVSDGEWHHVVWLWDRDVGNKFYIDGKLDTTDTATNSENIVPSENFSIGGRQPAGTAYSINGTIDELHVFKRALTEQEVENLFKKGLQSSEDAVDYSGSNNHGSVSGATWSSNTGHDGFGAYEFNAANDDYIEIGDVMPSGAYTLTGWIKREGVSTVQNNIIAGDQGFKFWAPQQYSFHITAGHDPDYNQVQDTSPMQNNVWYFVAVTFDPDVDSGRMILYKNGVQVSNATSVPTQSNSATTYIGKFGTGTGTSFNGTIDEVRIYNHTSTTEEIKALYNNEENLLSSSRTDDGETWSACITPNDGVSDGLEVCSNSISIEYPDYILNSTLGTNTTSEDLTVYYDISNPYGEDPTPIIRWFRNSRTIAVLDMPFDSNSSAPSGQTKDYSDNGNDGLVYNAVWNPSGGNNESGAYEFDGINNYIDLGDVMPSSAYTKTAWVKIKRGSYTNDIISGNQYHAFKVSSSDGFKLSAGHNDNLSSVIDTQVLQQNTWYFVAVTFDPSVNSGQMILYKDGTEVDKATNVATQQDSSNTYVGRYLTDGGFNGTVDEVRIYDRALSPQQIQTLSQSRNDKILSQELASTDIWQTCIIPNDGYDDGSERCSNTLTIASVGNLPVYSGFTGNTTDFLTTDDLENVDGVVLDNPTYMMINWTGTNLNVSDSDFTSNIVYGTGWVSVNISALSSTLNSDAIIELYGLSFENTPIVYEDGDLCTQNCDIVNYTNGNLVFNIGHFTNYSTGANSRLEIWDETDPEGGSQNKGANDQINFYANYTNITLGNAITNTEGECNISFNVTPNGPFAMVYSASTQLWKYNRSFSIRGEYEWNVTCNSTTYEKLNVTDTVILNALPTQTQPILNASDYPLNRTSANLTVIYNISDSDSDETTAIINWYKDGGSLMVLNMPFDSENGCGVDCTKDYSGYGNNATINGSTWISDGYIGGAYDFNAGIPNVIEIPDSPSLRLTNTGTIALWIKPVSTTQEDYANLVTKANGGDQLGISYTLIWWQTSNVIQGYIADGISSSEVNMSLIVDTDWHHITFTWNSTDMMLYLDGALQNTESQTVNAQASPVHNLRIGGDAYFTAGGNQDDFDGKIDEVKIYQNSLSPEQVKALYNNRTDLIVSRETTDGDTWQACVTPNDGTADGTTSCSNNVNIGNTPPEAQNLVISSSDNLNRTNGTLSASWTYYDSNGGTEQAKEIKWYKNDTEVASLGNYVSVGSSSTEKGEVWKFSVRVTDGSTWGDWTNSSTLRIENTAPYQTQPTISSTSGRNRTTDNITLTPNIIDLDGDDTNTVINWYSNSDSIAALYLPFEIDDNCGASCTKDYSGNGNDGDLTVSPTWTTDGYYGGGYDFDGVNDYITVPNSANMNNNSFTVSTWFNIRHFDTSWMGLLTKMNSTWKNGWRIYVKDSLDRRIRVNADNGSNFGDLLTPVLTENTWYHLALTYDEQTQIEILYLNGDHVANDSSIPNMRNNHTNDLKIGILNNKIFNGTIDEVRLYGRTLSPQQVKALYNNRTDLIVSQETSDGDILKACVTPNDGIEEGTEICSDLLTIQYRALELSFINPDDDRVIKLMEVKETINATLPRKTLDLDIKEKYGWFELFIPALNVTEVPILNISGQDIPNENISNTTIGIGPSNGYPYTVVDAYAFLITNDLDKNYTAIFNYEESQVNENEEFRIYKFGYHFGTGTINYSDSTIYSTVSGYEPVELDTSENKVGIEIQNFSAFVLTRPSGPVCGNLVVESGEECDDGNTASGDGCSSSCQTEDNGGGTTSGGGGGGSGGTADTCSDRIRNQGETGVDCGGPCLACPSCFDGLMNCHDGTCERGVDCEGPCATNCAAAPRCDDGIQNGYETGVDCGGHCSACPTCTDNVRNQGETGVDCGGPCSACAPGVTGATTRPTAPLPGVEQPPKKERGDITIYALLLGILIAVILFGGVAVYRLKHQEPAIETPRSYAEAGVGKEQQAEPVRKTKEEWTAFWKKHSDKLPPGSTVAQAVKEQEEVFHKDNKEEVVKKPVVKITEEQTKVLEQYIHRALTKGFKLDMIEKSVIAKGWPQPVVEEIVSKLEHIHDKLKKMDIHKPHKNLEKLEHATHDMLSKGYPEERIRQALYSKGWNKSTVDQVIAKHAQEFQKHHEDANLDNYKNKLEQARKALKELKAKGYDNEFLKNTLLKKGWKLETVNQLIKEL